MIITGLTCAGTLLALVLMLFGALLLVFTMGDPDGDTTRGDILLLALFVLVCLIALSAGLGALFGATAGLLMILIGIVAYGSLIASGPKPNYFYHLHA
jgi:hypothetical protein